MDYKGVALIIAVLVTLIGASCVARMLPPPYGIPAVPAINAILECDTYDKASKLYDDTLTNYEMIKGPCVEHGTDAFGRAHTQQRFVEYQLRAWKDNGVKPKHWQDEQVYWSHLVEKAQRECAD